MTCSYCTRPATSKICISRTKMNNNTRYLCTHCSNKTLPSIQRDIDLIGGSVTVTSIPPPAHHSSEDEEDPSHS